ncbi:MAG: thioredoxin domain-containing protein [Sulfurimonas sp.]|nr:thioredoxin domain-containing protein [Sulfurimonas sp.]MDQ7061684.1 thioredoxin domain-containing protein [Sulfurimonas sp.]
MLKLLATALLLSSVLAANTDKEVRDFLKESFSNNPAIVELDVEISQRMKVPTMKGWDALIIVVNATVKAKPKNRKVKQKMIWFTDGKVITKELTNIKTGESLKDLVSPTFKDSYYKKENLIYGNADATHKIAIFSDPLCPFCGTFVPKIIKEMKKQPNKFAVYYYHFPLPALHPAAVELSLAAIAAELQGKKDVVLSMYNVNLDAKERNVVKILKAFNKTMHTNIKPSDLQSREVQEHFANDLKIADAVMVQGTPTMFLNGVQDKSKRKWEKVK